MAKIILQFATQKTISSFFIGWFGHGWASHVDVVYPNGLFGAMLKGGCTFRKYEDHSWSRTEQYALECDDATKYKFDTFMMKQLDKPYDWRNILAFLSPNRNWLEDDSWFCSELVAAGLIKSGFFKGELSTVANKITPQDLMLLVTAIGEKL